MRLSEKQITIIKNAVTKQFDSDCYLYLFGSRVDNNKKGGDIDLLVELKYNLPNIIDKKIKILADIKLKIGEQKIDLIITEKGKDDTRLVVKEAYNTGILL